MNMPTDDQRCRGTAHDPGWPRRVWCPICFQWGDAASGTSKPAESPQPIEASAARSGTRAARMDCPSAMREHFWSHPIDGKVECLWCREIRDSQPVERAAGGNERSSATREGMP
jgi:hypothetical protein